MTCKHTTRTRYRDYYGQPDDNDDPPFRMGDIVENADPCGFNQLAYNGPAYVVWCERGFLDQWYVGVSWRKPRHGCEASRSHYLAKNVRLVQPATEIGEAMRSDSI